MKWLMRLACAIAFTLATLAPADATVKGGITCPDLKNQPISFGGREIKISGRIDDATVEEVRKLFDYFHKHESDPSNCEVLGARYVIDSPGGDPIAAMALGRLLRKEQAHLIVENVCASACVMVLAGAVDRNVGPSARVAIHRFYFLTPSEPVSAEQVKSAYTRLIQDTRAYLREMNVSERLVDDMLAVEPERMRVLTQAELEAYGLSGIDPSERQRRAAENEARELAEAMRLGIDRIEYNRRKRLGLKLCLYADWTQSQACKQQILEAGQPLAKDLRANRKSTDDLAFGTTVAVDVSKLKFSAIKEIFPGFVQFIVSNLGTITVVEITIGYGRNLSSGCSSNLESYDGVKKFAVNLSAGDAVTLFQLVSEGANEFCIVNAR